MSNPLILTVGDLSGLKNALQGVNLQGRREPRIAMVGRSNVGKSSLINALLGTKAAYVSETPGKTRALHFYAWPKAGRIIADLPGYGYAKVSAEERERWSHFIQAYLKGDEGLERALILLDARHGPTDLDEDAIRFIVHLGVRVTLVFTKSDALKTQAVRAARKRETSEALSRLGFDPAEAHWVSSKNGDGIKVLTRALAEGEEL